MTIKQEISEEELANKAYYDCRSQKKIVEDMAKIGDFSKQEICAAVMRSTCFGSKSTERYINSQLACGYFKEEDGKIKLSKKDLLKELGLE